MRTIAPGPKDNLERSMKSTSTHPDLSFRDILGIYATGFVYMITTAVALLLCFCFALALINGRVGLWSAVAPAASFVPMIAFWILKRKDDGPTLQRLDSAAFWFFYASACFHLFVPLFALYRQRSDGNLVATVGVAVVILVAYLVTSKRYHDMQSSLHQKQSASAKRPADDKPDTFTV